MTPPAPTPRLQQLVEEVLGPDLPVAVRGYDGTHVGPADAPATIVLRSPRAFARIIAAPGVLGVARAYASGDVDVEGDMFAALRLRDRLARVDLGLGRRLKLARVAGLRHLRPVPPPPEEFRPPRRTTPRVRVAEALAHHYDISNRFYRLLLGPSMAYTCAVYATERDTLDQAQENKYELVCRKLRLRRGDRLLDVGCGWGGMLRHAATHHGVRAVGVTLSERQMTWAQKEVADAGLGDRVEVRLQDYRDIADGPYDAISAMGVFEHLGFRPGHRFFSTLRSLLRPGGRLVNQSVTRPVPESSPRVTKGFIQRYVFPESHLHEIGAIVSGVQDAGLEARHMESLREHYVLTLRHWYQNLEENWGACVDEVGLARARVWRVYFAGFALYFESNEVQVQQVLAVRTDDGGGSGLPLRPWF